MTFISIEFTASNSENYINSFFVARRGWEYLFEANRTRSFSDSKASKTYRDYEYDYVTYDNEYYAENGYVACNAKLTPDPYFSPVGYINGEIIKEELLYHLMDEKFLNSDSAIYGVSYFDDMEENECIRRCKIVANYTKDLLYKITLLPSEGGEIEVQDYNRNIYFDLSPQDHGLCIVSCKNVLDDNVIFTSKIVY